MLSYLVLLICSSGVSSQFNYFSSSEYDENKDWIDPKNSFISKMSGTVDGIVESGKKVVNIVTEQISTFSNDQHHADTREVKKCSNERNDICLSFLSRFINIILRNTGLKYYSIEDGKENKVVTVDIAVTRKTLDALQRFAAGDKVPFDELDESFVSLFDASQNNAKAETNYNFFDSFDFKFLKLILGLVLAGVVTRFAFFIKKAMTRRHFFFILFFVYYTVCVGQSLWIQYEDAYAKRIITLEESMDSHGNLKIPNACYPSRQSFWERIKYSIFWNDDMCKRYMDSKKSIFSALNFEEALTKPLYGMFFEGIPNFGRSCGKALYLFTEYFGFPLNIILPVMIIYFSFNFIFAMPSHFFRLITKRRLKGLWDYSDVSMEERMNENRTPQCSSSGPIYHITNPSTVNISNYGEGIKTAVGTAPSDVAKDSSLTTQEHFLNSTHLPGISKKIMKDIKHMERKNERKKIAKNHANYLHYLKSLKELKHLKH